MATVSSHTLNGTDGSHAGGIGVTLRNLTSGELLFSAQMDAGGRLMRELADIDTGATYEMVFATGPYWAARQLPQHGVRIMSEVVVRFSMPDPQGRYHIPLVLSPNAYSLWCSTEHG